MIQRGRAGRHGVDAHGEQKYLGELQARIMEIVWSSGPVTVRDVLEDLAAERDLAYTTVMTVMTRLWEGGTLLRERVGKTYVYRAAGSREEFRASISGAIVQDLVADFGEMALAQFADALERADPARLARLRTMMNVPEGTDGDP